MTFPRVIVALASLSVLASCGVGADEGFGGDEAFIDDGAAGLGDVESELTKSGRFEYFVGRDGQTYFHLLAGNGERVLASEGYFAASSTMTSSSSLPE